MKTTQRNFVSKFTPAIIEAEIREMPVRFVNSQAPEVSPQFNQADDELPPPIPEDAMSGVRSNTLDLSTIRSAAAEAISEITRRERAAARHAASNEAIGRFARRTGRGGWQRRSNNPRIINAKFPGTCAETQETISEGDSILWTPGSRLVYCATSRTYQNFQQSQETNA